PRALEEITSGPSLLPATRPAWQMAGLGGFSEGLKVRTNANLTLLGLCTGSSALRQTLDGLFQASAQMAADLNQTQTERLAAIRLLGQTDSQTAGPTLEKLLEPQQPAEMQTAAAN